MSEKPCLICDHDTLMIYLRLPYSLHRHVPAAALLLPKEPAAAGTVEITVSCTHCGSIGAATGLAIDWSFTATRATCFAILVDHARRDAKQQDNRKRANALLFQHHAHLTPQDALGIAGEDIGSTYEAHCQEIARLCGSAVARMYAVLLDGWQRQAATAPSFAHIWQTWVRDYYAANDTMSLSQALYMSRKINAANRVQGMFASASPSLWCSVTFLPRRKRPLQITGTNTFGRSVTEVLGAVTTAAPWTITDGRRILGARHLAEVKLALPFEFGIPTDIPIWRAEFLPVWEMMPGP